MAIGNVVLNDGTDHTYVPMNIGSNGVYYLNTAESTLALPDFLEIQHTPGSQTRPDRHLVKLGFADDNTDGSETELLTIHVVATLPRKILTPAQMKLRAKRLATFMNSATYMDALLFGGYPA